jgi:hypothetical protein
MARTAVGVPPALAHRRNRVLGPRHAANLRAEEQPTRRDYVFDQGKLNALSTAYGVRR